MHTAMRVMGGRVVVLLEGKVLDGENVSWLTGQRVLATSLAIVSVSGNLNCPNTIARYEFSLLPRTVLMVLWGGMGSQFSQKSAQISYFLLVAVRSGERESKRCQAIDSSKVTRYFKANPSKKVTKNLKLELGNYFLLWENEHAGNLQSRMWQMTNKCKMQAARTKQSSPNSSKCLN